MRMLEFRAIKSRMTVVFRLSDCRFLDVLNVLHDFEDLSLCEEEVSWGEQLSGGELGKCKSFEDQLTDSRNGNPGDKNDPC